MAVTGGDPTLGSAPGRASDSARISSLRVAAAVAMGCVALAAAWIGGFVFAAFWWVASIVVLWEWQRLVGAGRLAGRVAVGGLALALASLVGLARFDPLGRGGARSRRGRGRLARGAERRRLGGCGRSLCRRACREPRAPAGSAPAYGLPAILWLFAVVWGTDIVAYFAGRLIGGPRLWPTRFAGQDLVRGDRRRGSPAGVARPLLVAWTTGSGALFWLGLATAVVSELGDLFESAMKRRFGVKDSSRLIPGHGGLMDRLDGFHRGVRLRRDPRGRAFEGRLHRERAVSMVIASRAVEAAPPRSRQGAPAPSPGAAETARHPRRDGLDRALLRASDRRRAGAFSRRRGRRRAATAPRSRAARSSSAPNSPRSPTPRGIPT